MRPTDSGSPSPTEALLAVHEVSDPRRYDADRLDAMSYLLDRTPTVLRRDRERMERLASIGAVSAVRIGQPQRVVSRWLGRRRALDRRTLGTGHDSP